VSYLLLDVGFGVLDEVRYTNIDPSTVPEDQWSTLPIIRTGNHLSDFYAASGTMDFSHTARFGSVAVTNLNGSDASDLGILSDNGFQYELIPEPSTWVLFGVGLFLLLLKRRASGRPL